MKKIINLTIFSLLFFGIQSCFGGELEVNIVSFPQESVLGAPIYITTEVRNVSGKELTLSCVSSSLPILEIRDEEGRIIRNPREVYILRSGDSRKVVVPENWIERTTSGPITYLSKAQKYFIRAIVSRKGPYYYLENGKNVPFNAWEGEVISETVIVEVTSPKGINLECYNYFKGDPLAKQEELMYKFPTSTYTGEALIRFPVELSSQAFSCLNDPDKFMNCWFDRGGGEESVQKRIREAKDSMNKYNRIAETFLEAHTNFYLNPMIRRKYIMCLGFTGQANEAQEQLKTLAKGEGKEAEEAREFLEHMEGKKKMEAAPVEKSVPEAKEEK